MDANSHSVQVRLGLPANQAVLPGSFARARFMLQGEATPRLFVPAQAVIHRTELDAVYVVVDGKPLKDLKVDKVAGASWTSDAFNKALEVARQEASIQ